MAEAMKGEAPAGPASRLGAPTTRDPVRSWRTARRTGAVRGERSKQQRDQYLRAAAELDNVRKRAQRDIESAHRYALERFAAELLPVRDSWNWASAMARTA